MSRHPLHPALVHFPVACWSLGVAVDAASFVPSVTVWLEASERWSAGLFAVGCLIALPAMLAGMAELPRIPEGPAFRETWAHMTAMLTAFALFLGRLVLGLDGVQPQPPGGLALTLAALGFVALAAGGWLGGRLVYHHGIGRE